MRRLITSLLLVMQSACYITAQSNGCGAEILKKSTHVTLKGSKLVTTDTLEILILDRRGDIFSNAIIPFTKGDKFSLGHAQIRTLDGTVVRTLKKKEVRQSSLLDNSMLYSDTFVKYFSLRHNVYPYILSCSYTHTTDKYIVAASVRNSGNIPIRRGRLTVETTEGFELFYHQANTEPPTVMQNGGISKYTWEYSCPEVKKETWSADRSSGLPSIKVVPRTFRYGKEGSWESWESFGNWIYRLNEGLDDLPTEEKRRIDAMLEGVEDLTEKTRILYHYLQDNHRYINVKIDIGGLKSYPAGYVCANRFGDCKALSNYFRAMLKYAGIESYYTLIDLDDEVAHFDAEFPFQIFNHVIVSVPRERDTLYVECTSRNGPLGYVGPSIQGRKALVTKPWGSHLVDMPALTEEDVHSVYRYKYTPLDGQSARMEINAEMRGFDFVLMTAVANEIPSESAAAFMRKSVSGGSFTLDNYSISQEGRDSHIANLYVSGYMENSWRKYGTTAVMNTFRFDLPAFESPEERKLPVQIDYPVRKTVTATYDLSPLGAESFTPPDERNTESEFGTYSVAYELDGNKLTVTKNITIRPGIIPVEKYPEWYSFITSIRNLDNSNLNTSFR